MNLVSGIYYHPEAYPPTLNAMEELSGVFDSITIIHRPHLQGSWRYPRNVKAVPSGTPMTARQQEQSGKFHKALFFLRFTWDLLVYCRKARPEVVLLYDAHALFSYSLIRPFLKKHILWYHNHDICEKHRESKYSIGWFACGREKLMFSHIDLFTLPTKERLGYFPIERIRGEYIVVPNFPSRAFYERFRSDKHDPSVLRLIYQGRIGEGHGIEQVIRILGSKINGKVLHLVLKGHIDDTYKNHLVKLAGANAQYMTFHSFTAYEDVPRVASGCDVGIAIFEKKDTMNATLGTASNKVFEYAALGLPVLYLKDSSVATILKDHEWGIPVSLDNDSLPMTLADVDRNLQSLSAKAVSDFDSSLNFEVVFRPVLEFFRRRGLIK